MIDDIINWYLKNHGEAVSGDQYKERLKVCESCPWMGDVNVFGEKMKGCTKCGCPSSTKPRFRKYFNPTKLKTIWIKCPLEKWEQVDILYNQKDLKS